VNHVFWILDQELIPYHIASYLVVVAVAAAVLLLSLVGRPLLKSLIPMTHSTETGAINRLHFFPAPVSGPTCVMQIWDRIRLVPETGAD